MLFWSEAIVIILISIIFLPVFLLFIQTLLSFRKRKSKKVIKNENFSSIILIPAHNEALIIEKTITSIQNHISQYDKIIVVADNCSDDTFQLVQSMDIEVLEREDTHRRGKSYALDFGIKHISNNPPDVILIIDADCDSRLGNIQNLINYCGERQRPIQSLYLMSAVQNSKVSTKIAAFAWIVKNKLRPLAQLQIGLPCQLMGSGMAFPWSVISNVNLASGSIVEDLKLGLDCALQGKSPEFYPESIFTSEFPLDNQAENTQRTRWEHGHLLFIFKELPYFFNRALRNRDINLLALVIDAAIPPLSLLVIIQLLLILLSFGLFHLGFIFSIFISVISFSLLLISILLAWSNFGRDIITLRELVMIPVYIVKKIPIYLKFLVNKQISWVKTKRS